MLELCSRRRFVVVGVSILILTTIIIIFENRFASDPVTDFLSQQQMTVKMNSSNTKHPSSSSPFSIGAKPGTASVSSAVSCPLANEHRVLMRDCIQCNPFEQQSGLAKSYCVQTGFYNEFACSSSKQAIFESCRYSTRHYDAFLISSWALTVLFAMTTKWRQWILDRRAYAKMQVQMGN